MTPTGLLTAFKTIGLVDHLAEPALAEAQSAVQRLAKDDGFLPLLLLAHLPGVAYLVEDYGALSVFNARERWNDLRVPLREIVPEQEQPLFDRLWEQVEVDEQSFSVLTALNAGLATQGRDERFYHALYADYAGGPYRSRAVLFLSYPQFKSLQEGGIFKLAASHAWSQARVDDFVNTLEALGLFGKLTGEQRARVQQARLEDYDLILRELNLVVRFEREMIRDPEVDYRRLLSQVLPLSGGLLLPEALAVSVDANDRPAEVTVAFRWNGRAYSRRLADHGEYVNNGLFYLLNEALGDQGCAHRFCLLETGDQTSQVIFLDGEQLRRVKAGNLLPLDEWFEV